MKSAIFAVALLAAAPAAAAQNSPSTNWTNAAVKQIERCWTPPFSAAQGIVVELDVQFAADGTATAMRVVNIDRYKTDPLFRAAVDSAVRAVRNPHCSPIELPVDKFSEWQNLTMRFNSNDLR